MRRNVGVSSQGKLSVTVPDISSPCISICALDEDDVCMGCYRTGDEITDWFVADDERKREILKDCEARRDRMSPIKLG
jgi:predicted Fe-S protein YdhL (DUF1289 family)